MNSRGYGGSGFSGFSGKQGGGGGGAGAGGGGPWRGGDSDSDMMDSILTIAPLSPQVRVYLARVYRMLALMMLLTVLGVLAHIYGIIGVSGGTWSAVLGLLLFIAARALPEGGSTGVYRRPLALGFSFLEGMSLGPLVALVSSQSSQLVVNASVSTLIVFVSFSAAAMITQRRTMIYLGGVLATSAMLLLWMSLLNMYFGSAMILNVELYFGLLVFCGYIMFDTQRIIHRANDLPLQVVYTLDDVNPALDLHVNLVAIFIRILVILSRRKLKGDNDNDSDNDSGPRVRTKSRNR